MRKLIALFAIVIMFTCNPIVVAQDTIAKDSVENVEGDSIAASVTDDALKELADFAEAEGDEADDAGFHQVLKTKFIEGNAGFMSLVAITLILGLAFCIERMIYLIMSEVNAKKLIAEVDSKLDKGDVEGAKELCRNTRGPVALLCYQALMKIDEDLATIERSMIAYGSVLTSNLERGCSWITLFITIAPSLGFLGTVVGMVMAFDDIRSAGDISTSIVAEGMMVALITTVFGIIVAVILQLFYNYILSRIDHITSQMEEATITMIDIITSIKRKNNG